MKKELLCEALGVRDASVVAIVGGGGKSSLMAALGREYHRLGIPTLMTTTTHIRIPENALYIGEDPAVLSNMLSLYGVMTVGTPIEDHRLGQSPLLEQLPRIASRVVIEADGTRGLPLKVPNEREPVIPEIADAVVAVAGLSALLHPLGEVCHRPELAQKAFHLAPSTIVTPEIMAQLLCSPLAQRKNVGERPYAVLLNQADVVPREAALQVANLILDYGVPRVVVAALQAAPDDYFCLRRC